MNHHSFRQFIKQLPTQIIKDSNINPAHFKAVAFVLSMYGDYSDGSSIFPSWLTVAREAGVNRKTAMKVRDWLLENGLLIEIKKREKNIAEYKFAEPSDELSLLVDQLSIIDNQLSVSSMQLSTNIGHNSIIDTTIDTDKTLESQEEELSIKIHPSSLTLYIEKEEEETLPDYEQPELSLWYQENMSKTQLSVSDNPREEDQGETLQEQMKYWLGDRV